MTMNALRAPSASVSHSPPPASGSPAPAVRVSRHVPGCGSPTVNGGPVQSGSRQSAPARNEWTVGVTTAVGTAESSTAFDSTSGTDDSITLCVRKPATPGYASATRLTVTPGSCTGATSRIDTRSPPRASFVTLTESTVNDSLSTDVPFSVSEKSRDWVLHLRPPSRKSVSDCVRKGTRVHRRLTRPLLSSIALAPTVAFTFPSV